MKKFNQERLNNLKSIMWVWTQRRWKLRYMLILVLETQIRTVLDQIWCLRQSQPGWADMLPNIRSKRPIRSNSCWSICPGMSFKGRLSPNYMSSMISLELKSWTEHLQTHGFSKIITFNISHHSQFSIERSKMIKFWIKLNKIQINRKMDPESRWLSWWISWEFRTKMSLSNSIRTICRADSP